MIAVAVCFLCSALLGLRLVPLIGFIPVLLIATVAAIALQDTFFGMFVLVILQAGYFGGVALRAVASVRSVRPALRRVALR